MSVFYLSDIEIRTIQDFVAFVSGYLAITRFFYLHNRSFAPDDITNRELAPSFFFFFFFFFFKDF